MKRYSKKWMGTFINGKLPDDKTILDEMSRKAFEVESIDKVIDPDGEVDSLFEIKVLPNRVADAMSLEGMAREVAAVFDMPLVDWRPKINLQDYKTDNDFVVVPQKSSEMNPLLRFTGFKVKLNLKYGEKVETPNWIKDILNKSGGRPINCLVDITNLILFSFGQPAHVFDFDKLVGKIVTRFANEGEEITLLDGKKLKLKNTDFVIADEKQALSIAGIKGGKQAEVDDNTTVAYFELANFQPTMIRKTTQSTGVRTDASKIFENGISTNKTLEAMQVCLATVKEIYKDAEVEFITDILQEEKNAQPVEVNIQNINSYGGLQLSFTQVQKLLERQAFKVEDLGNNKAKIIPPHERLDINIEEDVSEEVLRIYGFDNIKAKELLLNKNIHHNPRFLFENYLKIKLLQKGYTEVFNYTFGDKGNVKVKMGLASDKEYLRNNLFDGAKESFVKNYNFLPILQTDILKFFEIGSVFLSPDQEEKRCVIVCDDNKKKSKYLADIENILQEITNDLGIGPIQLINKSEKPAMVEFSIDKIIESLGDNMDNAGLAFTEIDKDLQAIKYTPISVYPFIVRDVAMWVPEERVQNGSTDVFGPIKNDLQNLSLENLEKLYMFDSFTKTDESGKSKTSIAFRLIFQSYDKTLTDAEVEKEMSKVNTYLQANHFEVR